MKKIRSIFLGLLLIGIAGCKKDFFDINENPNSPTEESMTPDLILPRVLHASADKMATDYDYAAHWMGYWARSGNYGPTADQESYNITTSYEATSQWGSSTSTTSWYDILTDVNTMERLAKSNNQQFYIAVAKILKSIGFMYLVDQYNNVPYSEAFSFPEVILPKYDKGQDIYADLLNQLDSATVILNSAEINVTEYNSDIMFGVSINTGSFTQEKADRGRTLWKKLANTMKLKLLIHESEVVSAATVSDVISKIQAEGSGFLSSGETAVVQPGYQAAANQQNPFYDTYKSTALGATDQYNRANNYVLGKYRNNSDVRYQYVFSAAQTPLNGNTYYGYNFGEELPNDDPYKAINSSDVAGPGLAKSATQAQWFFTSVESLFLQAEAIQRGWLSGVAKDAYERAVTESFVWFGVPSATNVATAYLSRQISSGDQTIPSPVSNWNSSTDKITLIVTQKYLALCGINNFEAWVDYRRLGVPSDVPLSLYSGRNNNRIPLRLLYPQNEYNYNAANVAAEGTINAQTSRVFWDPQ